MGERELPMCVALNRWQDRCRVHGLFAAVSRLGDGVFWYTLMLGLPLVMGRAALPAAVEMAVAGLLGRAVYGLLKRNLGRRRPFLHHSEVRLGAVPLDRFSFPSGHTLHAVSFTALAVAHYPALAWLLVPFTVLVALSRVVLGVHYPTDVAAGILIGASVAWGVHISAGLLYP
ncbi:MAG: phosphatase PAP2 family protein [Nitrospirae bacterium]|nr:phosphatase PAP2 family protein [Nitrospirota bacterium]